MTTRQPTLFEETRSTLADSIELTAQSLREYGKTHRHWAIAFSGGKDSTALVTIVPFLIRAGRVPRPESLTICYADTRMELPPLQASAMAILARLRSEGYETRVALPPMDDRYFVYMFGRGVPPPSNTFRWCTGQLKVEPMEAALHELHGQTGEKILMLTGVRIGESAQRDERIALSCGKDGAECGQGWYQQGLDSDLCNTLAPILHWRVCLVWDWLLWGARASAPAEIAHGYPTAMVAESYGLDEEGSTAEQQARTGCNGCPLATRDSALDLLLRNPEWQYLTPLKELRPLYRRLKLQDQRLRKPGGETRKDGSLSANQNRMGPLTFEARRAGLATALDIQRRCNDACPIAKPCVDTLNAEEVARIEELIAAETWPNGWDGTEPRADQHYLEMSAAGEIQRSIFDGGICS